MQSILICIYEVLIERGKYGELLSMHLPFPSVVP